MVITSAGAVTPVGADVEQTFTSVRAGLRRLVERPDIYSCLPDDPRFDPPEPVVGSAVYHLDPAARAAGRIAPWLAFLAGRASIDMARRARPVRPREGRSLLGPSRASRPRP